MAPRIAVTLGDPRGIGPEVVRAVLADPPRGAEFVAIGPGVLLDGLPAECVAVGDLAASTVTEHASEVSQAAGCLVLDVPPETAGKMTALQIEHAVGLALRGEVDAVVTGPAEKRALHLAGYEYPGHTEWLGELAGGVDTVMMLSSGALRVVLITTHIPLRAVPAALTVDRVVKTGNITRQALADWWGIDQPRLAVCALNPHAGEGGLFGDEDDDVLAPAARQLGATGPVPADTVFVRALNGEFDAVLAPYHDVGMTAVKVSGFGSGVNVTLGLPFVRTAPDHGTAFDIAGKGIADAGSMREAVSLAVTLARARRSRLKTT